MLPFRNTKRSQKVQVWLYIAFYPNFLYEFYEMWNTYYACGNIREECDVFVPPCASKSTVSLQGPRTHSRCGIELFLASRADASWQTDIKFSRSSAQKISKAHIHLPWFTSLRLWPLATVRHRMKGKDIWYELVWPPLAVHDFALLAPYFSYFSNENDPKLGNNDTLFPHFVGYSFSLTVSQVPSTGIRARGPPLQRFSHPHPLPEPPSVHGEGKQLSLNEKTPRSQWLSCKVQHTLFSNPSYYKVRKEHCFLKFLGLGISFYKRMSMRFLNYIPSTRLTSFLKSPFKD